MKIRARKNASDAKSTSTEKLYFMDMLNNDKAVDKVGRIYERLENNEIYLSMDTFITQKATNCTIGHGLGMMSSVEKYPKWSAMFEMAVPWNMLKRLVGGDVTIAEMGELHKWQELMFDSGVTCCMMTMCSRSMSTNPQRVDCFICVYLAKSDERFGIELMTAQMVRRGLIGFVDGTDSRGRQQTGFRYILDDSGNDGNGNDNAHPHRLDHQPQVHPQHLRPHPHLLDHQPQVLVIFSENLASQVTF